MQLGKEVENLLFARFNASQQLDGDSTHISAYR